MKHQHDVQTIFQRFSHGCEDRRRRLSSLLDSWTEETTGERHLNQINQEVRDWIGESKMLGLDKVTAAADELKVVLESWATSFRPATQGAQLRTWIWLLTEISRSYALQDPDNEISDSLQELRQDLRQELCISEFREVPTDEIAGLCRCGWLPSRHGT
jgi:hypothetical protein